MAISAAMVKELRERTGLGMMDCKKALAEAHGDMDQAIEDLRKKSSLKAAKKAGRTADEEMNHQRDIRYSQRKAIRREQCRDAISAGEW